MVHGPRARIVVWPPPRLAWMRRERGSVVAVLPAAPPPSPPASRPACRSASRRATASRWRRSSAKSPAGGASAPGHRPPGAAPVRPRPRGPVPPPRPRLPRLRSQLALEDAVVAVRPSAAARQAGIGAIGIIGGRRRRPRVFGRRRATALGTLPYDPHAPHAPPPSGAQPARDRRYAAVGSCRATTCPPPGCGSARSPRRACPPGCGCGRRGSGAPCRPGSAAFSASCRLSAVTGRSRWNSRHAPKAAATARRRGSARPAPPPPPACARTRAGSRNRSRRRRAGRRPRRAAAPRRYRPAAAAPNGHAGPGRAWPPARAASPPRVTTRRPGYGATARAGTRRGPQ